MADRVALTDSKVAGIKSPPAGQVEIADSIFPGLRLRASSGGARTWILRKRIGGRARNFTLGHYPAMGLAAARKKARDVVADADHGRDPVARLPRPRAGDGLAAQSFAAWWETYLDRNVRGRLRSASEIERRGRKWIIPALGDRPVAAVTRAEISRLVEEVAYGDPDNQRLREARHIGQTVSAFYSWALPMLDQLPANPAIGALKPPPSVARDRVLSDDEMAAFWRATGRMGWPWGPAFRLLLLTAQRRGEVFGALWSEVDGDVWTIPSGRVKNKTPQLVPLSPAVREILDSLPRFAGCDHWFPAGRRPSKGDDQAEAAGPDEADAPVRGSSGFSKAHARLLRYMGQELGLPKGETAPHFVLHDLRRTAATGMQRLGIALPVVEAVLNHVTGSRSGVVGVYQRHQYVDEKRRALEAWAAEVARITGGATPAANVVQLRTAGAAA